MLVNSYKNRNSLSFGKRVTKFVYSPSKILHFPVLDQRQKRINILSLHSCKIKLLKRRVGRGKVFTPKKTKIYQSFDFEVRFKFLNDTVEVVCNSSVYSSSRFSSRFDVTYKMTSVQETWFEHKQVLVYCIVTPFRLRVHP